MVATTNQLDKLDKSLRRGGRLDLDIRLDMPTDKDRFEVLKEHLKLLENEINDQDLLMIARASSGFVSSDIAQIVRNCHLRAVREKRKKIMKKDLEL